MDSALACVIGGGSGKQGAVRASAAEGRQRVGDGCIDKLHILNGHTAGGEIGRQKFMQNSSLRSGDDFSAQIFRGLNRVVA